MRVHFNIFKNEINRFDIECYEEKQKTIETVPLKIKSSKKKLYLNLNECSDRLHLSKEKLKTAQKNKSFLLLWTRKLDKIKLLDKINNHYQEIIKNYRENINSDLLFAKKTRIFHQFQKDL